LTSRRDLGSLIDHELARVDILASRRGHRSCDCARRGAAFARFVESATAHLWSSPVLFDFSGILNAADLGKYVMLAVTHPEARIVLAHMGGTRFHDMLVLAMLQEYDWYRNNLWVDLSAVSELYARSPYKEQLVYVIRKIGVDRVLFGSDFPFVRTPAEAIDDVESLGLTADEERMIFHDNAAALLRLQQRE
jgi:predicted TIM-barrel fold metal-dependent hydrolase